MASAPLFDVAATGLDDSLADRGIGVGLCIERTSPGSRSRERSGLWHPIDPAGRPLGVRRHSICNLNVGIKTYMGLRRYPRR